jgi:hypothetical protein
MPKRNSAGLPDSGSIVVFRRDPAGWSFERELVASDEVEGARFASAVVLTQNSLLLGAPGTNAVHSFEFR